MPDGEAEYPPQFASSDLSALLGQINDFAGVPPPPPPPPPPGGMEMKSAKAPAKTGTAPAAADLGKLLSSGYSLPVTIVGSAAQRGPYLPGLRDQLIAVTILRLAEQIVDPVQKTSAQKLAYDLMASGTSVLGAHIAKQRKKK